MTAQLTSVINANEAETAARVGRQKVAGSASQRSFSPSFLVGSASRRSFSPSFALPRMASFFGPRAMKDMGSAGDSQRNAVHFRRQAASTGQLPNAVDSDKIVRCFTKLVCPSAVTEHLQRSERPAGTSRHKKRVPQIYRSLDTQLDGTVRLTDLRDSFEAMSVPNDDQTFHRHAQDLLPAGARERNSRIKTAYCMKSHKSVRANQPGSVRWNTSDAHDRSSGPLLHNVNTALLGNGMSFHKTVDVVNKGISLPKSQKLTSLAACPRNKMAERLEASLRYASAVDEEGASGNCDFSQHKFFSIDEDAPSTRVRNSLLDDSAGDMRADFLARLRARHFLHGSDTPSTMVRDFLLGYGTGAEVDSDISMKAPTLQAVLLEDDMNSGLNMEARRDISGRAREALAARDDIDADLRMKAREASEAALLGSGIHSNPIVKARKALDGGLLEDDNESDLQIKARKALEAALLEDDIDSDCDMKARDALEAALLGGDNDSDSDCGTKASETLEATPLGDDIDPDFDMNAHEALEAALLQDDNDSGFNMKAREASEVALLEDDNTSDLNMKACEALEAAPFGDDNHAYLKMKAREALDAAPLGDDNDANINMKAHEALDAALLADDIDSDLNMKAREALEAELLGDDNDSDLDMDAVEAAIPGDDSDSELHMEAACEALVAAFLGTVIDSGLNMKTRPTLEVAPLRDGINSDLNMKAPKALEVALLGADIRSDACEASGAAVFARGVVIVSPKTEGKEAFEVALLGECW